MLQYVANASLYDYVSLDEIVFLSVPLHGFPSGSPEPEGTPWSGTDIFSVGGSSL
jgi:hypothetical protein